METIQFKTLLDQVNTLSNHYKKINDLTGENFNIFRILKLESSEVRLHSAFLAELLNPKGNHGQKDTFLKLFIDAFCFKGNAIDTESCTVEIEKHTVSINETYTEGGYIDILITDKKSGNQIVIENKIYAGDQKNQMLRYYNHNQKADLIYLTLDGKEPHEKSYGTLKCGEHFKCISYKKDILNWLEQCRKEVAVYPIVRESITQYINLIKYLTNQTINDSMQTELNAIIKSKLEASFLIKGNLDKALYSISNDFGVKLKEEYKSQELLCDYNVNFNNHHTGFWIYRDSWRFVKIRFCFEEKIKKLIYGFSTIEKPDTSPIPMELRGQLSSLPNNINTGTPNWPWYQRVEDPYNNWEKYEAWEAIIDERMIKMVKEKVGVLLKLTEDMDL